MMTLKIPPSMLTLNIYPSLAAILDLNEKFNSGKYFRI